MSSELPPLTEQGGGLWSIMDGHFDSSSHFPDLTQIESFRKGAGALDESISQKILYRALMIYAFKTVNPAPFEDARGRKTIDEELDYAASQCVELGQRYIEEDLKKVTPDVEPKEVPIMQALKAMQEAEAISREERIIMDGAVRAIFLRQHKRAG